MSTQTPALVDSAWLEAHLNDPHIKIIDASYFIVGGVEKALELYREGHIPGAVFFDINAIADTANPKDHAFPNAAVFAEQVGKLGISNDDYVVAYDRSGGTIAAARAWFMFRAFGHDRISLLDGGQDKWMAENRPLSRDIPTPGPRTFTARETQQVFAKRDMLANLKASQFQILDARSKGRFDGTEPEPRPGLRSGHIPGSYNLPSGMLIDADRKTWKDPETLAQAFRTAGVDLNKPLTTTCGSGVTACALAFGAFLAGKADTKIYDGSWMEWGADGTTPVEVTTP